MDFQFKSKIFRSGKFRYSIKANYVRKGIWIEYPEVVDWCKEQFEDSRYTITVNYIMFKDESDYTWFVLKWGSQF